VVDDVMARIPEHRDQPCTICSGWRRIRRIMNGAARAGVDDIRQKRYDAAAEELEKATDLNPRTVDLVLPVGDEVPAGAGGAQEMKAWRT